MYIKRVRWLLSALVLLVVTWMSLALPAVQASSLETFRDTGILLSKYKKSSASSYSKGYYSLKANDGNNDSTRWSAADSSYPQWWKTDLGSDFDISKVKILWYHSQNISWKYKIEISTDNKNFITVIDRSDNPMADDTSDTINQTGRYVRITVEGCSSPDTPASLFECSVFGTKASTGVYPLKVSPNGRYLVETSGKPYFLAADTGWMLFSNISRQEADFYLENRRSRGINTILCYAAPFNINSPNKNGHKAFIDNNLATPDDKYFEHVDDIIRLAETKGMQVVINPAEMDSYSSFFTVENARELGRYMGKRYKNFKNIIWFSGGDIHPTAEEERIADSLARGILDYDKNHLISFHPAGGSSSSQFVGEYPWLNFNMVQVFGPDSPKNYQLLLSDYEKKPAKPVVLIEPCYENNTDGGSPAQMNTPYQVRRAIAWGFLSGGFGMCYGEKNIYKFLTSPDWKSMLDEPGLIAFSNMVEGMGKLPWYKLVPDTNHTLLSKGSGTSGSMDYAAAGLAEDGSFGVVYLPTARPVTINMECFNGKKTVRWFSPTSNTYVIEGTYENKGSRSFEARPGNSAGEEDWFMIID